MIGGEGESTKCKTLTVGDAFAVGRIESKNVKVILFTIVGEVGVEENTKVEVLTKGGGEGGVSEKLEKCR